jgi:urea transport system permease protein
LSLEVAVWVAIGGRNGLCGAILGATLVNLLRSWMAASAPLLWPFILSLLVLLVVLALPNGLLDMRNRSRDWLHSLLPAPGRSRP